MSSCPPVARRASRSAPLILALALLGTGTAAAQDFDLTGAWTLSVMSPNGAGTRDVTFVQDGKALTGEIASSMASGPLTGTIEGDSITFVARVYMESGAFEITYRAIFRDGELKEGTVDFGSYGSGTFTGRRKEGGAGG